MKFLEFLYRLKNGLLNLINPSRLEKELRIEVENHLDRETENQLRKGATEAEAKNESAKQFGHVDSIKEECRDSWGARLFHDLAQDFRYGLRQLRKARGFTTVSILTVAIGIGACTALFSIYNAVLLKPLAYGDADRLVKISTGKIAINDERHDPSVGFYFDLLEQSTVYENLSALTYRHAIMTYGDNSLQTWTLIVTPSYFNVFEQSIVLGRAFFPEEATQGNNSVVILHYDVWQSQFGGRADVLNQKILIEDHPHTIVGVVHDPEIRWSLIYTPTDFASQRSNYVTQTVITDGLLKPDVTLKEAQSEIDLITARVAAEHPQANLENGAIVTRTLDIWTGEVREQLLILIGAVGLLLLIACANVASLLLARANVRQKELAVRCALGASRGRLIRQLLCESALISLFGGALGILFAYFSLGPLARFSGHAVPRIDDGIPIDGIVLTVSCGLMLLASLFIGLIPALQATRRAAVGGLKDSGRGPTGSSQQHRLRSALVITEIAIALMLLTGTGLLIRSLSAMQSFDQGMQPHNVYLNEFDLMPPELYDTPEKITQFTDLALERFHAEHDITSAAMTTALPMGGRNGVRSRSFSLDGDTRISSSEMLSADYYKITQNYFDVMSIPLIRGRTITTEDTPGATPVVVINQETVQRHFLDQDPIGQRVMIFSGSDTPGVWHEIVGVVGNVKPDGPVSPTNPQFYTPFVQDPQSLITLILRTHGPSPSLSETVSRIIESLNHHIALKNVHSYEKGISNSWAPQRFGIILLGIFSGIALLLACIGVYGVMSYLVSQRTHEIGIRMALGALPRDVLNLILHDGARIVIFGVILGAAGSLAGVRVLESLLFNTNPYDPGNFVSVAFILSAVALLACYLPARLATKVNPMIALRAD